MRPDSQIEGRRRGDVAGAGATEVDPSGPANGAYSDGGR
jgi:hypothetical protein